MLTHKNGRTELATTRAMAGRTCRNAAMWIASEDEAQGRIALPQATASLRHCNAIIARQAIKRCQIGRHVSAVLVGERLGNAVHDSPQALVIAVVIELLVDDRHVH